MICNICNEDKLPQDFSIFKSRGKEYYRKACRKCRAAKQSSYNKGVYARDKAAHIERKLRWEADNAEKVKVYRRHAAWRNKGIDPIAAEALYAEHDGKCGLCQEPIEGIPNVDHCHATGKVRDILCRACNHGLGNFKDSPRLLLMAVDYLNTHSN